MLILVHSCVLVFLNYHFRVSSVDLYCTLEVDSFGYFVSKAITRVFRDTTEPHWNEVSLSLLFVSHDQLQLCIRD